MNDITREYVIALSALYGFSTVVMIGSRPFWTPSNELESITFVVVLYVIAMLFLTLRKERRKDE